jgi:hypothetical protein
VSTLRVVELGIPSVYFPWKRFDQSKNSLLR